MKRKQRYLVRADEVIVTRGEDYAEIEYKEPDIPVTRIQIGMEVKSMSDQDIVNLFNEMLRANAELAAKYKHVAVEVPLNSKQIEYSPRSDQWSPRGGVLRCLIESDGEGQVAVAIDDQELSLLEFGRMLSTYEGWGMRIEFVPEDEVHRRPAHEVREPGVER